MTNDMGISVHDTLAGLAQLLKGEDEVFAVYDRNVAWVAQEIAVKDKLPIDTSEALKTMDTVLGICKWLMDRNASRKALLVAVGGGITTDLTGFAASIYKRGIRYANVPTTLLAQVDAAIGGKTGVNFLDYKNMLGAFRMPEFTYICPEPLRTLPEREYKAGLAEMLKTFLIADGTLYERAVREGATAELVSCAASIKAGIVSRDPYEKGERTRLNLGHTFAHAIEHEARIKGESISHGEAVAIGIIMAAEMSEKECVAKKGLAAHLRADFKALGLPTECPYEGLEPAMRKDKKAAGGKVMFVLPVVPGEVCLREIDI